ncbi:hypothetical protein C7B62_24855 [Pleurocapsa sp. CCALA 161]|uniref:hypothetical protein n=1 Tax=Pleurocapsa sp. CCALA 161 TaxID=2107688 RepID=UPI000D06386D|nr:hypothetical protein [Pleurocapsa sp. CCALA 161]PSB05602.1 hypothetical protein C7B62_24855 [Pleurocapsa sp. CCALA 161]
MPTCDELATKAELQELRDQLNAVLGEKEDGSKVDLFAKGASNAVLQAGVGVTLLGMAKNVAPKAVTDIILEGAATGVTWQKLASMNTGIKAKFGNGTTGSLAGINAVANTAGNGAGVAQTAAKVGGTSGGSIMLLGNLVQIAGTLALNKATVDIMDARIEAEATGSRQALDQINNTMLRLYEKNNGEIAAASQDIENQNAVIANTQQQVYIAQSDISQLRSQNSDIYSKLEDANQTIYQLQVQNVEARQEIANLQNELTEAKVEFTKTLDSVETQLNSALEVIEILKADIESQDSRIATLEGKTYALEEKMLIYEIESRNMQYAFQDLREDLDALEQEDEEEALLKEIKSKLASAKLIIEQHRAAKNRRSGSGAAAMGQAAAAQTGVLELTNKLSSPDLNTTPVPTTITREDLQNNPQTFRDRFEALLDRISPNAVTPEQIEDLQTGIRTGVATDLTAIFGSMIVPRLDNIADATSEPKIAKGVQTGICNSLNGGSCPPTPTNPNPTQGLQGMNDGLNAKLAGLDLLQGAAILGYVKNTNEAVRHAKYGLEAVQGFADKAWKATHADKILNGITTALVVHNAIMLSSNLGQTIGDATSSVLNAIGIKDSEDNPIDVNTVIRAKMTELISSVIGSENYAALTKKIAAANRIYQSAANVLDLTRSLFDSARNVAELTAENTGKIGNALREAGAVYEDAYDLMQEKVNPQNQAQRRLEGLANTLGDLAEGASAIAEVSEEVIETKENIIQLKAERKQLEDETKLFLDAEKVKKDEAKAESQAETELAKIDFARDESDTGQE